MNETNNSKSRLFCSVCSVHVVVCAGARLAAAGWLQWVRARGAWLLVFGGVGGWLSDGWWLHLLHLHHLLLPAAPHHHLQLQPRSNKGQTGASKRLPPKIGKSNLLAFNSKSYWLAPYNIYSCSRCESFKQKVPILYHKAQRLVHIYVRVCTITEFVKVFINNITVFCLMMTH